MVNKSYERLIFPSDEVNGSKIFCATIGLDAQEDDSGNSFATMGDFTLDLSILNIE